MRDGLLGMLATTMLLACPSNPPAISQPPSPSASTAGPTPASARAEVLHDPVESYDLRGRPDLRHRLLNSHYAYFRFTNLRFANAVCTRFSDAKASMPLVNLHGDAHLEQYAVTSLGRGLADYDDASTGPAVLDLVRFGTSLRLAGRARGWDATRWIDAFLEGYRDALKTPDVVQPAPACVSRITASFSEERLVSLAAVEALMVPLDAAARATFEAHYARYVVLMRKLHPEQSDHFFKLKKLGRLQTGVGSALNKKFLMRVEGDTDAPDDDVVLEAKELRDLGSIGCMTAAVGGGAFRILLGQTRVGGQPMRFLAQIPRDPSEPLDDKPIWVQAWLDNYHELSIEDPELTDAELFEVSRDVGVQLGRGHVMKIADPMGAQLRVAQLQMLRELEPRIRATIDDMTKLSLASWKVFVTEVGPAR